MMYLKIHQEPDLVRTEFRDVIDLYIQLSLHIYHPRIFTNQERELYKNASHDMAFREPIDLESIRTLPSEEAKKEKIREYFEKRAA